MKECIAKLLREDKLCSVFTNDAEKFMAGYLLDSDGEYMLMELFNPYDYSDEEKIAALFRLKSAKE